MKVTITKPNLILNMISLAIVNARGIVNVLDTAKNILLESVRRCVNCGKALSDGKYICEWCGYDNGIRRE